MATMKFLYPIFFIILIVGCKNKNSSNQTISKQSIKDSCLILAGGLEEAAQMRQPAFFNDVFSIDYFLTRMQENDKIENLIELLQKDDIFERFRMDFDYGSTILTNLGDNGYFNFTKYYEDSLGQPHIVFRIFSDAGLNYFDYLIVEKNGQLKIGDVYNNTTSEWLSSTMRNAYISFYSEEDIENISELNHYDKDFYQAMKWLQTIGSALAENNYSTAMAAYQKIPESMLENKLIQTMGIRIASGLGNDSLFLSLLRQMESSFPKESVALDLLKLDVFFVENKYDSALFIVDRIENTMGEDPMLNYYRGNLHFAMEQYPLAEDEYQMIIQEYPAFEEAYGSVFSTQIIQKDYQQALETLTTMHQLFDYPIDQLEKFCTQFPDLTQSEDYKTWIHTMKEA